MNGIRGREIPFVPSSYTSWYYPGHVEAEPQDGLADGPLEVTHHALLVGMLTPHIYGHHEYRPSRRIAQLEPSVLNGNLHGWADCMAAAVRWYPSIMTGLCFHQAPTSGRSTTGSRTP